MNDLIERLQARVAHEKAIPSMGHNAADREHAELIRLLTKASYALEVARAENKGHRIAIQQLYDENEALRAEVDRWKSNYNEAIELKGRAFAESRRLAEAINAYKSECDNPAKDYVLRAKRRDEMFALLREQDQEGE